MNANGKNGKAANPDGESAPAAPGEKQALQRLLQAHGLRPQSKWGQNFLIDLNLLNFIARAAGAGPGDLVLEVGPGTARLSRELARAGAEVLAVELDRGLAAVARAEMAGFPNFSLIEGDVLAGKSALNPEALAALAEKARDGAKTLKCVSNLPYSAGTPVIANLLSSPLPWARAVFLLQYEVGQRLLAAPGGDDYGILAVKTAFAGRAEILRRVPPDVFWPVPGVDSAVVRIDFFPAGQRAAVPWAQLDQTLRAAFGARRKTLAKALRGVIAPGALETALARHGLRPDARAEDAPPEAFLDLARALN